MKRAAYAVVREVRAFRESGALWAVDVMLSGVALGASLACLFSGRNPLSVGLLLVCSLVLVSFTWPMATRAARLVQERAQLDRYRARGIARGRNQVEWFCPVVGAGAFEVYQVTLFLGPNRQVPVTYGGRSMVEAYRWAEHGGAL